MFKKKDQPAAAVSEPAAAAAEPTLAAPASAAPAAVETLPLPYEGFGLPDLSAGARAFGFSIDSAALAVATNDMRLHLWDPEQRRALDHLKGFDVVAFSPRGRYFASKSEGLSIFEVASGKELWMLPGEELVEGHRGWWTIQSARFAPDGAALALSLDEAVGPTHQGHSRQLIVLYDVRTARQRKLEAYRGGLLLGFSPDGKRLALRPPAADGEVAVVDLASGAEESRLAVGGTVLSAAFMHAGQLLCGSAGLSLWDLGSSECLQRIEATAEVESIGLAPDGSSLVTADRTGWTLRDPDSLELQRSLPLADLPGAERHQEGARLQVAFSPDGHWLAAGEVPPTLAYNKAAGMPVYVWQLGKLL